MRTLLFPLCVLVVMLSMAPAAAETPIARPQIANGAISSDWPEVAAITSDLGLCSATLVGCRTVITAAHCVCDPSGASGVPCGGSGFILDPVTQNLVVYLPQAGFFSVEEIRVPPTYVFGIASDLAVLKLGFPVRSLRPRALNTAFSPFGGTPATIVGFGSDQEASSDGLGVKRVGAVTTSGCINGVPDATHVCWQYNQSPNICGGDSGGPLLADLGVGAGPTLVGVHSGLFVGDICELGPSSSFDTNVFADRLWIAANTGADLGAASCGDGPQVGDAGVTTLGLEGDVSTMSDGEHIFFVSPGTQLLRVGLNGEVGSGTHDIDLYLQFGSPPSTTVFECSSAFPGTSLEYCEIVDPVPGTWHALVDLFEGPPSGPYLGPPLSYQLTVTLLPDNPPPPLPELGQLLVSNFASFELMLADPSDGGRATASSSLRGIGADLAGPEGIALESDGSLLVANAFAQNLLRVDPTTGNRTVVSGCADLDCSSSVGDGPDFLSPRFVALEDAQHALVTDRLNPQIGGFVSAVVRVNLMTGDRSVVSGCSALSGESCSPGAVRGTGPDLNRVFGIALEESGQIIVVDGQAVLRIDPTSGNRVILSGCPDPSCTNPAGMGPDFGEPTDLVIDGNGDLFVTYQREGFPFGALRRVDPVTGERTLVSGCKDTGCTMLRGSGPGFLNLFGITFDAAGDFFVADLDLDAVLHVDRETGDRTVVSGCLDEICTSVVGSGSLFSEPLDLVVVPEAGVGLMQLIALLTLVASSGRRPSG